MGLRYCFLDFLHALAKIISLAKYNCKVTTKRFLTFFLDTDFRGTIHFVFALVYVACNYFYPNLAWRCRTDVEYGFSLDPYNVIM